MDKRGGFATDVAVTFLARAITTVSTVGIMVIAARLLGPSGKGEYAYLITLIALGVQFGNWGAGTATLYYASRHAADVGKLLVTSAIVALLGGVAYVVVAGGLVAIGSAFVPLEIGEVLLTAVAVVAGLLWTIGQNILVGIGEVLRYNALAIIYSVLAFGGTLVVFWFAGIRPVGIVAVLAAAAGIALMALRQYVVHGRKLPLEYDRSVVIKVFTYGFSVYVSQTVVFALVKCDLLMVQYYLDTSDVGLYSLAGDFSQAIIQLQAVFNMLLFPRLAAAHGDAARRRATRRILLRAALAYLALMIILLPSIHVIVPLVFGGDFDAASGAVVWLLPGAVALALASILQNHLGAIGRPGDMLIAPAMALVVDAVFCTFLIPRHGLPGAAVAASAAFCVMLGVAAWKVFWRRNE
jgi:O-antigen/teichoic acid export membrane protein